MVSRSRRALLLLWRCPWLSPCQPEEEGADVNNPQKHRQRAIATPILNVLKRFNATERQAFCPPLLADGTTAAEGLISCKITGHWLSYRALRSWNSGVPSRSGQSSDRVAAERYRISCLLTICAQTTPLWQHAPVHSVVLHHRSSSALTSG